MVKLRRNTRKGFYHHPFLSLAAQRSFPFLLNGNLTRTSFGGNGTANQSCLVEDGEDWHGLLCRPLKV